MKNVNGRYLLNDLNQYISSYGLGIGTYTINNVPMTHPVALLNASNSNISYKPIDNTPIVIKVSGGNTSANANNDYYDFTLESDNSTVSINGGSPPTKLLFMRGRTYRFVADGINSSHPFKLFVGGAFVDGTGISGTGTHTDLVIPSDHSTNVGDIYYQCGVHAEMKGNMSLLYGSVSIGDNDGNYDFVYGDMEVTVTGDFNKVSLYCFYHGYMGGKDLLKYKTECSI